MLNNDKLAKIRKAEKEAHIKMYSSSEVHSTNSWLQKPVKIVQNALDYLDNHNELRVLDLGCGIGRNSIFVAEYYQHRRCIVECVDLLDIAIERLYQIAEDHGVKDSIYGIVRPIENFKIQPNAYDLILAISVLEHIDSESSFLKKIVEIKNGLKKNGIACFLINSNIKEVDLGSGKNLEPQFEIQMSSEKILAILDKVFANYHIVEHSVKKQEFDIPRGPIISRLYTDVVAYMVQSI